MERTLVYEKLPADIASRRVLLLDPILATGHSAAEAIKLLMSRGVPQSNIVLVTLIAAPQGIHRVCGRFPEVRYLEARCKGAWVVPVNLVYDGSGDNATGDEP